MIATLPFLIALHDDENADPSKDLKESYFWIVGLIPWVPILILHAINLTYAKIPIGIHTLFAVITTAVLVALIVFVFRVGVDTIVPFEVLLPHR